MIANTKIEIFLLEDKKETLLKRFPGKQITSNLPITVEYLKSQMPSDLFDSIIYKKVKDEVWGSGDKASLDNNAIVHNMPNLTYVLYVEKK